MESRLRLAGCKVLESQVKGSLLGYWVLSYQQEILISIADLKVISQLSAKIWAISQLSANCDGSQLSFTYRFFLRFVSYRR